MTLFFNNIFERFGLHDLTRQTRDMDYKLQWA